jgi:RNA polymerase sigma factor (sigma-70 family)
LTAPHLVEHFFRHEYGRLVALLARRVGVRNVEAIEDAVQSALMIALESWTLAAPPDNPSAWLFRVAHNNLIRELRQRTRRLRILEETAREAIDTPENGPEVFLSGEVHDSLLQMLFVCCDESIPVESQLVLALKTLCGFDINEISLRLFTSEANIYKRLGRARSRLREYPLRIGDLTREQCAVRLPAVSKVLYLLFTEGYLSSHAELAIRRELCDEAIRLALVLAEHPVGQTPETFALLALMHLHAARMTARMDRSGGLLLLEEQARELWDQDSNSNRLGVVSQICARRYLLALPRGSRDCGGTLPRTVVSGNAVGQSGGVLRDARADRTLRNSQTQPRSSGSRVARTCRRTRGARGL